MVWYNEQNFLGTYCRWIQSTNIPSCHCSTLDLTDHRSVNTFISKYHTSPNTHRPVPLWSLYYHHPNSHCCFFNSCHPSSVIVPPPIIPPIVAVPSPQESSSPKVPPNNCHCPNSQHPSQTIIIPPTPSSHHSLNSCCPSYPLNTSCFSNNSHLQTLSH